MGGGASTTSGTAATGWGTATGVPSGASALISSTVSSPTGRTPSVITTMQPGITCWARFALPGTRIPSAGVRQAPGANRRSAIPACPSSGVRGGRYAVAV
ncbi:hypothetical protein JOF29_007858 [Kribbella aluminosa]|uniref:Uncharacterized protein n=1 Tax=Kribbella aluminosa TaxID=416017 RepID=A0ABS4UYL2_9ACTN|nr:hypothetical protein [Kribbella aluminosa]MBP2356748.1 hypothetical protein [Kribbella aluminosa]